MAQGPLNGVKILEFNGIGPGPFCGMLLSDMGADALRIDRKDGNRGEKTHVTRRGRKSVALDLKVPAAREACLKLMETADALYEGFRPGVMERLGLGPDVALARNPKLVYGRMTGWGQTGPLSQGAGHDIDYIAITGALHAIGTKDRPVPPLNLVGDFGGADIGRLATLGRRQRRQHAAHLVERPFQVDGGRPCGNQHVVGLGEHPARICLEQLDVLVLGAGERMVRCHAALGLRVVLEGGKIEDPARAPAGLGKALLVPELRAQRAE